MSSKASDDVQPFVVEWNKVASEALQEVSDVDIQQTFYALNPKEHHAEYISTAFPNQTCSRHHIVRINKDCSSWIAWRGIIECVRILIIIRLT